MLQIKSNYREWIKRRFNDIDALENEGFEGVEISTPSGQSRLEHIIKLDTAKEMAQYKINQQHLHFIIYRKNQVRKILGHLLESVSAINWL